LTRAFSAMGKNTQGTLEHPEQCLTDSRAAQSAMSE
jgi:hypothetical protein